MTHQIFDRTPLLVIDTATNTFTRYIGTRRVGRWTSGDYNLSPDDIEALRADPAAYLGEEDPRGAA